MGQARGRFRLLKSRTLLVLGMCAIGGAAQAQNSVLDMLIQAGDHALQRGDSVDLYEANFLYEYAGNLGDPRGILAYCQSGEELRHEENIQSHVTVQDCVTAFNQNNAARTSQEPDWIAQRRSYFAKVIENDRFCSQEYDRDNFREYGGCMSGKSTPLTVGDYGVLKQIAMADAEDQRKKEQADLNQKKQQGDAEEALYRRDLVVFQASFAHRKVLGDYVCGSSPMIGIAVIGQVEQVKGNLIQVRESVPSTQGSAYHQGTPGYDHLEWIEMNSVGLCRARTRLVIVHECQNMMGGLGNLISPVCQMTADFSAGH